MIALLPPAADFDRWAALGARGWDATAMSGYFGRLAVSIVPVAPGHRNPYLADVIEAASAALGIPVREDWNTAGYRDGTGFVPLGYYPQTGVRSSSSVAYLHPVMGRRGNLDVLTGDPGAAGHVRRAAGAPPGSPSAGTTASSRTSPRAAR